MEITQQLSLLMNGISNADEQLESAQKLGIRFEWDSAGKVLKAYGPTARYPEERELASQEVREIDNSALTKKEVYLLVLNAHRAFLGFPPAEDITLAEPE